MQHIENAKWKTQFNTSAKYKRYFEIQLMENTKQWI